MTNYTNENEKVNLNELNTLQEKNQKNAKRYSMNMLRSELMRNKLTVTESMKVLTYIDPTLTHLSRASKVYAKWLKKASVMDKSKKAKALDIVPATERGEYEKMATALEIRTRFKFRDKTEEYQSMKVGVEYNKWLVKFMESDNGEN